MHMEGFAKTPLVATTATASLGTRASTVKLVKSLQGVGYLKFPIMSHDLTFAGEFMSNVQHKTQHISLQMSV